MTKPFLIFAMPRSMTAWTSCFLTVGGSFCTHEFPYSTEELAQFMENSPFELTGVCDPSLLLRWEEVTRALPEARLVYLRRPSYQSQRALAAAGDVDEGTLEGGYHVLNNAADQFIQHCEPRIIDFAKLQTREGLTELCEAVGLANVPLLHVQKMLSLHIEQKPELIRAACANSGTNTKS